MSDGQNKEIRRRVLAGAVLGTAVWLLKACGLAPSAPTAGPTAGPAVVTLRPMAPPTPVPSAGPTATASKALQNENRDPLNVRYYRRFPAPNREGWRLEVTGLVERPQALDYTAVLALPAFYRISRMKCVECWSARAKWEGFQYPALEGLVQPNAGATHLRFDCADGYYEYLALAELKDPSVVFVTKMNDALLPDEYGAPLRMIVPWKYGYKGAKAITRLTFVDQGGPGYWSTVGPYTVDGNIEPGFDQPQDLGGSARQISGGEITQY